MSEQDQQADLTQPEELPLGKGWLRNYLPMGIGQIVSLVGSALVQFALVWYVTKETGSATVLATATTAAIVPNILLGPFVGALVDRWNRKLVMIIADLVVALATVVLAVLFATGVIQIWHIVAILLTRSAAGVFQGPARTAATTLMVPKEHLSRLGGVNQAVDGMINVFSPALGALLLAVLPMQGVLAVDIVTAGIAISMLIFFVKVPQPKTKPKTDKVTPRSLLADVREAVRYIVTWPGLLLLVLMASLLNMFLAPGINLLPLHVIGFFGKGVQELAWMQVAMGIGGIVGGLWLGVWGGFKRRVWTVLLGIIGLGTGMLAFGLVPADRYTLSLVGLGMIGLMASLANGSLGPLMQTKVPSEVQGRVFMLLSSLTLAMMPIGLFLSAPIADHFGTQVSYIVGGSVCLVIGLLGLMNKHVNTLDLQKEGGALITGEDISPPVEN
ncbi:MAG TPA: MFS transporter [Anaerolineaceae bacterium]|nr:MFS transporter [Anaerolineaceae bacterium]